MSSKTDALCIGETMVLLTPAAGEPLEKASRLDLHVAGAESNVAAGMAHLGQDVSWFGRVGRDPLGKQVLSTLSHHGIDLSIAEEDPHLSTGLYFKEFADSGTAVHYYRRNSAASAMSPEHLPSLMVERRRLCHLSGITPALSSSCEAMVRELVENRTGSGPLISFDINYRPKLWSPAEAAPKLLDYTCSSDIVIVGRDEAQTLWNTTDADSIRELLPNVPELVVKDDDIGATAYIGTERYFVPALQVEVVEAVGAGDAFAAGYLAGLLSNAPPEYRLRLGHLMAGYALKHVSDLPPWPAPSSLTSTCHRGRDYWEELRSSLLPDDLASVGAH